MSNLETVLAYHALSCHEPQRAAPGPGRLDWATQPAPFRHYQDAAQLPLLHRPLAQSPEYDAVFAGPLDSPAPLNLASVSQLLYDSLALSAWKEASGNRWALRVNPSSGNLHPTEAYLLPPAGAVSSSACLAHYRADDHALELRAELPADLQQCLSDDLPAGGLLLALSDIPWREAWKYGERAYRYCQLDAGHALAGLAIAASALGWQLRVLRGVDDAALDAVFGLDRDGFHEHESISALCWIGPPQAREFHLSPALLEGLAALPLQGRPNRLSPSYRDWPQLSQVLETCRAPARPPAPDWRAPVAAITADNPGLALRPLLHQRRSAQAMDGRAGIRVELLAAWLQRLLPQRSPVPFACTGEPAEVDLLLFIHRVEGLAPGLYWLDRSGRGPQSLRADFAWAPALPDLPLYRLLEGDARGLSAFLSCEQDIVSDGVLALAMLVRLDEALADGAWRYPRLYWECGQIGQLLYLEAEAAGLSGTGIGCFFDHSVTELLGIPDKSRQSLYHFTIGRALTDERISSLPAYSNLRPLPV